MLTHWGLVTHMCISKLPIIGQDKGLLPVWRQAVLSVRPLGTNIIEIQIKTQNFSFMHLKTLSANFGPFFVCVGWWLVVPSKCAAGASRQCGNSWYTTHHRRLPNYHPLLQRKNNYHQTSNISHTKSPNFNVSRLVLQLSLSNPLKPGVK